ncbi:MAG: sulfatase [Planctomycetota bacterium]|jgi:arylsulfatase A-like enzyme
MNRRSFLKKGLFSTTLLVSGCSKPLALFENKKKLNFVFILIDDLGWADLGCYGSSFYETPNIDKLASEGMRFTQAYAASPVCSPTRASILSGKYPARSGLTEWIPGPNEPTEHLHQMPLEEVTIAEAFKEAGYATGYVGKWHLGSKWIGASKEFHPVNQGFDSEKIRWYYRKMKDNRKYKAHFSPEGEYLTDVYTNDALNFIENNSNNPFLLYLSHYAVHVPIQAKEEIIAKYKAKAAKLPKAKKEYYDIENDFRTQLIQNHAVYAAMIESVDQGVGKITQKLKTLGLNENTVIIFMSDNGGLATANKNKHKAFTANAPLREGKGWLYEGGIREPMIIKWPNVIKPGSICETPVISTDFYPTMLEMADLPLKPNQHIDGISLVPLLKGTKKFRRKRLYWHYPHFHIYGNVPSSAIRDGDYKLIEYFEYFGESRIELYNLKNDIGEKEDLSKKEPKKAIKLKKRLHNWRKSVVAKMPTREGLEQAWEKIEKGTLIRHMPPRKKR